MNKEKSFKISKTQSMSRSCDSPLLTPFEALDLTANYKLLKVAILDGKVSRVSPQSYCEGKFSIVPIDGHTFCIWIGNVENYLITSAVVGIIKSDKNSVRFVTKTSEYSLQKV